VTNPAYDPKTGLGDLAVVGFASAVPEAAPARLPTAGLLDRTPLELFTTVGYGLQGPEGPYDGLRRRAVSAFRSLDKAWLNLATSAKKSLGGTCFGDSGGPSFLGSGSSETEIVAALTVTGDTQCRSRSENLRLDTAASRAFLGRFVSLP
jgi:hypothetical protein